MPFPYQASATPVRTRKPFKDREKDREKDRDRDRDRDRDKDARSTPSGSSRKHREASRSSNRSPLPSSSRPASLYTQTNVTLDQLPSLQRSETASPPSSKSPTSGTSTAPAQSSNSLSSSAHFSIPASLQPYLETDDDDEFDDARTPQASSTAHVKPYFDADLVQAPSRPASTQKPAAVSPTTSTTTSTVPAAKAPSPQNPPTSPVALSRVSTRSSDPTPNLHHPSPFHIPLSSPTFAPAQSFFGAPPSEQYFSHPQQAPQYYPMPQPPGHPMDMQAMPPQNYYQSYGSPQQIQPPPFTQAMNPLARDQRSNSSRMSFSSDPFQPMGQASRMPTESALLTDHLCTGALEGEDDAVLKRIQNAIPDLSLLLTRYRQTSGQLGERETTWRQTEAEKNRVLEQKDIDIHRLTKDVHEAMQKNIDENKRHGEEKDKLRLEIGNMTEKHHELQESLQAEKKAKKDITNAFESLRAEHAQLISRSQEEKAAMTRAHEESKAKLLKESTAKDKDLAMKEKEHSDHQQRQARESEERLQTLISELCQKHVREMTEVTQKHAKDREKSDLASSLRHRELDDIHTRLRRDLNDARDTHKSTVDDLVRRHNQEREAWTGEREMLLKDWESERAKIGQGSEQLISEHQKEVKELRETWKSTEVRLTAEIENLKADWKADKDNFKAAVAGMRSTVDQLNTENSKLQKFADALEQVTDLRGRGDAFYMHLRLIYSADFYYAGSCEAFDTLQQQMFGLAQDFCTTCPAEIPDRVARNLPPNLPPFLDDTPASVAVRVSYVQSLISNIVDRRIFQPFLFTYAELDTQFNEWGECLRGKSTKREAIWRQRTLHAAFSCPSSKPRINTFAAGVVDEVIAAITPFVARNIREGLKAAVRKVIKTAAETWRLARIELPRIMASSASDESEGKYEGEALLSTFPRIERVALPRDFRPDAEEDDEGCVYTNGQTLFSHSPAILARRAELGENVTVPGNMVDITHGNTRADDESSQSRTHSLASQVDHSHPRKASLSASPTRTRSKRRETYNHFDGTSNDNFNQRASRSNRWNLDTENGSSSRHPSMTTSRTEQRNENVGGRKAATAKSDQASEHRTGSSPQQSPADSRAPTPQMDRRAMAADGNSETEDEERYQAGRVGEVPNWGDAGGNVNVPGAFGGRDDGW
ncbi:MAG: hypothetical protein Q9205_004150 [Flavoplaca limonia]